MLNATIRWATHYKWVIMVIVLFLGLALLALASALLHRRYRRRKEARSLARNTPARVEAWYPPTHDVHDFSGPDGAYKEGKGKGKGRPEVTTTEEMRGGPATEKMGVGRLKKGWLKGERGGRTG